MRKFLLLLSILTIGLSSCAEDDSPAPTGIVDNWLLTEVLFDPGDGSGTFQPADRVLVLVFDADGTVQATDGICSLINSGSDANTTGTYDETLGEIFISDCSDNTGEFTLSYEQEGNTLDVHPPCIEGCTLRFERIVED